MLPQNQKACMRWLSFLPSVVLAAAVLAGCQGFTTSPSPAVVSATLTAEVTVTKTPEQNQLEETVWVLQSVNGEPVLPDLEVTLEFVLETNAGCVVRGISSCNLYGAPYKITGDRLEIDRPIATAEGCLPKNTREQERQYYRTLAQVSSYSIEENTLTLTTETGGVLIFVPQE